MSPKCVLRHMFCYLLAINQGLPVKKVIDSKNTNFKMFYIFLWGVGGRVVGESCQKIWNPAN